jgi:hypothetical protein
MENKMKANIKKILILILAVLTIFSATAFAQPSGQGMNGMNSGSGQGRGFQGMSPCIEPIFMGHGFALAGEEYHILHVNVIKTKVLPADYIRSLLEDNKTPGEIAQAINSMRRTTEVRAHLRFAGVPYALNITSYDNRSFAGDILTLPPLDMNLTNFTPTVVGNISLSISEYEGEVLSTGTLTMNGTDYKVLLTSPKLCRSSGK